MRFKNRTLSGAITVLMSLSLVGCGAPDLSAMRPRVAKPAAAVVYVNHPKFENSSLASSAGGTGKTVLETIHLNGQSFATQMTDILAHDQLSLCVIAVDDANPYASDISQYARKYANIRFDVVSNVPVAGLQGSNISTLSGNPDATAYGIGYLTGVDLSSTSSSSTPGTTAVPPSLVFVPSSAPVDQQKAFFAGLYTADPTAQVVPMTSGSLTSTVQSVYSTVGSAVFGGLPPNASSVNAIKSPSLSLFSIAPSVNGPQFALSPGHIASTNITNQVLQFSQGHWQSGDETVVDPSSIHMNAQLLPKAVTTRWTTLQPSLAQTPTKWKTDFAHLPKATKGMLLNQFGLS